MKTNDKSWKPKPKFMGHNLLLTPPSYHLHGSVHSYLLCVVLTKVFGFFLYVFEPSP